VNWAFQSNGLWWPFAAINTNYFGWNNPFGVYIIANGRRDVVRLGQGDIMTRLRAHQRDYEICKPSYGFLSVTWAEIGPLCVSGVERYLANELSPLVGDAFPNVMPIEVNLPIPLIGNQRKLVEALVQLSRRRGI
jgi:hypothetical protein